MSFAQSEFVKGPVSRRFEFVRVALRDALYSVVRSRPFGAVERRAW